MSMMSIDECIKFVADMWRYGEAPGPEEPYLTTNLYLKELQNIKKTRDKDTVGEIAEKICSSYCKYPDIWDEEKEGKPLMDSDICMNCPLNDL